MIPFLQYIFWQRGPDMLRKISYFLRTQEYIPLDTNLNKFTVFFRMENSFVNVIHVIDITENPQIKPQEYERIVEKIQWQFRDRGLEEVHSFSFIISEDLEQAEAFAKEADIDGEEMLKKNILELLVEFFLLYICSLVFMWIVVIMNHIWVNL